MCPAGDPVPAVRLRGKVHFHVAHTWRASDLSALQLLQVLPVRRRHAGEETPHTDTQASCSVYATFSFVVRLDLLNYFLTRLKVTFCRAVFTDIMNVWNSSIFCYLLPVYLLFAAVHSVQS